MHAYSWLVEDHPQLGRDIREKHALGGDRVRVLWEAREGTAALRKRAQENVPEVVLMDISMPGLDGIETTRGARHLHPDLKIVMLMVMDEEHTLNPYTYSHSYAKVRGQFIRAQR